MLGRGGTASRYHGCTPPAASLDRRQPVAARRRSPRRSARATGRSDVRRARSPPRLGDGYWLVVDGVGAVARPALPRPRLGGRRAAFSVVRDPWPSSRGRAAAVAPSVGPVIYEAHVRGFNRTFAGHDRAARPHRRSRRRRDRADAGAPVRHRRQLLGVHAAGVGRGAPAVRRTAPTRPASSPTSSPPRTSAGCEVWLDVVFNHTGEGDATMPTLYAARARRRQRVPPSTRRHVHRRQRLRQRHRTRPTRTSAGWCSRRSIASPTSASTVSASTSPRC